jgi:tRNA (guanine37-N1)-methyltransferase
MRIEILTLFPEMFAPLKESIIQRAQDKGLVEIKIHNLRDWSTDNHKTVDSPPYGGGAD